MSPSPRMGRLVATVSTLGFTSLSALGQTSLPTRPGTDKPTTRPVDHEALASAAGKAIFDFAHP